MKRDVWALLFAMVFPSIMAWTYFIALSRPASMAGVASPAEVGPQANPALQSAYGLGKVLQFTFPLVYLLLVDRASLRPSRPRLRGLGLGIAFGLLVGVGIILLYHFGLQDKLTRLGTVQQVRAKVEEFGAATRFHYLLLAAFLSFVHSLFEEFYYRWFIFGRLKLHSSHPAAILWSSLAFMAHHVIVLYVYLPGAFFTLVVPFSLGIAIGGAFWAWLYDRSGSIIGPWVSHLLVDVGIMVVGYILVFAVNSLPV